MNRIYLFLFFILFFKAGGAQNIIHGKVVDEESRQPLQAASVMVSQTAMVTITDEYGNFFLHANPDATLVVSNVGYKQVEVAVNSAIEIKISLQRDVPRLKDIQLQSNRFSAFNSIATIDLAIKPVRNTQELLKIVPGLFIAQHAGGGKAEQIFLRGFDCDHGTDIAVSMDGMPVNMVSHAHGQGYADAHFIIPETIHEVDFGAGPYYVQQGNLNTAGYVGFHSFTTIDKSRVQVEGGLFDTFRALAMIDLLKKNKDKQSAYIATEYNYTNGPTINKQGFNRFNFFGRYNLALNDATQLMACASSFHSRWNASGQIPERAIENNIIDRFGSIDPTEGGHTQRQTANIVLSHHFQNGSLWQNQAYFNRYQFNLYSDFSFFLKDSINGDEINQAEKRNLMGLISKIEKRSFFKNGSIQSSYGAGIRYDATTNSQLSHVVRRRFLNNIQLGNIREYNAFVFTQKQLHLNRWLFDGGVRLDYLHFYYFNKLTLTQEAAQGKNIVSPKLNIQYTVFRNLQLYVKAGKGFHSNDTRVVIARQGQEVLPAAFGYDIGIIMKPTQKLYINLAAWYLHMNQEFVYVGDEGNVAPGGKTIRKGIDVLLRYQFSSFLLANFNVNFTRPRSLEAPKGANYIPLAPTLSSTGGLFYKKNAGWNGSLSYRLMKDRPANEDNSIIAKGYFLVDAALNYTVSKYEIGIAVENIFNRQWNEAQFAIESRLQPEAFAVTGLNLTPGTPVFARAKLAVFF